MAKMRAAQITGPNGPVEIIEREMPEPGDGITVEACGVCQSDSFTKEGTFPGIQYPRFRGMRLQEQSIQSVRALPDGPWVSGSVSAGTADTVATAILAGAAISSPVKSLLK